MKPLVIIPTYNERESLPLALDGVLAKSSADILVVDDNSPDGTGEYAKDRAASDQRIHLLSRGGKEGLAKAYIAGFTWGLDHGYTHLIQMDADGSHRPEDLAKLIERAQGSDHPDLVIGSRWMPGGKVVNWPKTRELLSRGGNIYNRLALGLPYTDITAGFRVYRSSALRSIDLNAITVAGYYWQTDMTIRFHEAGFNIVETPIVFLERNAGESKLSGAIFTESLKETTIRGYRRLRKK